MSDLFEITLADCLAELQREVGMRRKVYPRQVAAGKMRQETADRRIAVMNRALRELGRLKMIDENEV